MTLLIFLIVLSILVFVHELGHFWTAKKNGILVEEFGFGLPPRIWGKKIGETVYSVNLLPIGGFVKLYGEEGQAEAGAEPSLAQRAFFAQKKRVRALVIVAGVVMNFVLGVVLFSLIYSVMGVPTQTREVEVVAVMPGSPAEAAGVTVGTEILAVDGEAIDSTDRFVELIEAGAGREVALTLGEKAQPKYGRTVTAFPRENPPAGQGALGVVVSAVKLKHFPWWQMPFRGAWFGLKEALGWGATIAAGFAKMVKDLFILGVVPHDVAGPIGIFQLTGDAAQAGWLALLQFVGILSVNLAVLNILPLPALDGGRLLFLGVEAVLRRRISPKVERWTHGVGMALLLMLMVLITLNDIVRVTRAGSLVNLARKVWPF